MKTIFSIVVALLLQLPAAAGSSDTLKRCQCHEPEKGDTTRWGGNMTVEMISKSSYRNLEGKVIAQDGTSLQNALVEVFDHPKNAGDESHSRDKNTQEPHRLAACVTAADGKFCFRDLPAGKYELRASIDTGWDVTFMLVEVDIKSGKKKTIAVSMQLGT